MLIETRNNFESFMQLHFPAGANEHDKRKWEDRFERGVEWHHADFSSRMQLQHVAPEVYPTQTDVFFTRPDERDSTDRDFDSYRLSQSVRLLIGDTYFTFANNGPCLLVKRVIHPGTPDETLSSVFSHAWCGGACEIGPLVDVITEEDGPVAENCMGLLHRALHEAINYVGTEYK